MWILVGVVVVAVVLLWLAGRSRGGAGTALVDDIDDEGLVVNGVRVPWESIYQVHVMTGRSWSGTWYGFEVRSEAAGLLLVDRGDGRGERFLSLTYHLPGFDHAAATEALMSRRSGVMCYSR